VVASPVASVTAHALPDGARYSRDHVVATLTFQDGSVASLMYLANGDRSVPKEQFEVYCEGKSDESTIFVYSNWRATES
jgi:hypothetical protein